MTTYFWEKKESAGSWIPFEGSPTAQNPTEDFEAGTWDVRVTVSEGAATAQKTRNAYVTVEEAPSYVGPLDLVPGAVVAYGQRAMSAAQIGQPLYTLRKVGSSQTFNSDVNGDAPVADITTFIGGGTGLVTEWYDQSGNSKDMFNDTTANEPAWAANQSGGKPGFSFGAAQSDYLRGPVTTLSTGECCFFMVAQGIVEFVIEFEGPDYLTCLLDSSGVGGPGSQIDLYDGTNQLGGSYTGTPEAQILIVEGFAGPGGKGMRANGAALTLDNNFDIGGAIGTISEETFFQVQDENPATVLEFILYPSTLTSEQRTTLRQNIAAYYGITLS